MEENNYKCLNLKRASIKGRVTKFNNQLEVLKGQMLDQTQINVLKQRLAKIEALFVEFDSVQDSIEALDEKGLSAELDNRENVEQSFYNSIAEAQNIISKCSTTNVSSSEQGNVTLIDKDDQEVIGFRLPVIKISKFDGTFNKWLEFRDTFSSLIHNNSKINNIHKFHYLNSYLEGEAARVICNLEVSEINYPEAWDLLCKRYNNTRQLINNHLKSLFNIEPLRETDKSLRFLADHVIKNLRALNTLKQPTEHWDTLVVHMVSSKLDSNTRFKWEEYIQSNVNVLEVPSLENFMTFIKGRADILESVYRSKHDKTSKLHTNPNQSTKYNLVSNPRSFVSSERGDSSSPRSIKCVFCNKDHRNYECPEFQSKSIDDRLTIVTDLKLCRNCLHRGHYQNACKMPGTCKKCKRRHNTLLHIPTESHTNDNNSVPITLSTVSSSETLLCTALVDIINPATSEFVTTKALLDSGSQSSFITEALTAKLNLTFYIPIFKMLLV
ncbi:uncharacterized protein LOC115454545 [Manduca sexta]|uniref:uncharacterized protein LOC115454545 n=1 Tax=Manduca sexta TaxID=7130 RepID=UPI00188E1729|nr:uncharacterized protein LOC115454545 [Manduca sexta]XP_037300524.1 uncharacterized protein LOC115454545 [Manduca sexta]